MTTPPDMIMLINRYFHKSCVIFQAEVYEVAHVQPNQYQNIQPNEEEEDYVQIQTQNDRVVYAQIDLRKADKATPIQEREPYAEIIGFIRPKKNGKILKF